MKAIVVSFDRLNASLLGCYGNQELPTPHWDRLASESVVFDQHFGENFDPNAQTHAWWTGCYVFPRSAQSQTRLQCVIRLLREVGVKTCLVRQRTSRIAALGAKDFQILDELGSEQDVFPGAVSNAHQTDLESVVERAVRRWRELVSDGPEHALLWIAFSGLPAPRQPELTGREQPEEAVAASLDAEVLHQAVCNTDWVIGRLREELLDSVDADAPVLWVLTAAA
ncbi:MAG: sulfatase-like hydrolase/transferase, partial [Planctomycetes bacterium]|nr:sulfatase-like hydrolase/transferase [Planctomycetota bacterium]